MAIVRLLLNELRRGKRAMIGHRLLLLRKKAASRGPPSKPRKGKLYQGGEQEAGSWPAVSLIELRAIICLAQRRPVDCYYSGSQKLGGSAALGLLAGSGLAAAQEGLILPAN